MHLLQAADLWLLWGTEWKEVIFLKVSTGSKIHDNRSPVWEIKGQRLESTTYCPGEFGSEPQSTSIQPLVKSVRSSATRTGVGVGWSIAF